MSESQPASVVVDPESLEVAPGAAHQAVEGWVPQLASEEELLTALETAFDFRGDVTISRKNGTSVEGYVFDRRHAGTLTQSVVRIIPKDSARKLTIAFSEIAGLAFTGRDTAAGKSWEAWVRKYWEKKAAGESGIGIEPEALDH